jgi:hypothetical protein
MVIIVNTKRPIEYVGFLPSEVVEEPSFFEVDSPGAGAADDVAAVAMKTTEVLLLLISSSEAARGYEGKSG